jgi:probable HAF family extracellular repeat protein
MPPAPRALFFGGWLALMLATALSLGAQSAYTLTDLGALGGYSSGAFSVNALGQVVGAAQLPDETYTAFSYTAFSYTGVGGMVDLGGLGGTYTVAHGVNASGLIVGQSYTAGNATIRAFLTTSGGTLIDLGTIGTSGNSMAYGINDSGTIVGKSTNTEGRDRAFSYTIGGAMTDLGTLGGQYSQAMAVSSAGHIVGSATTEDNAATHAFLLAPGGNMVDLGALDITHASSGLAVNASGQVVGFSGIDEAKSAFSYTSAGGMVDLGSFGGFYNVAMGLNDAGQIVGTSGADGWADQRAFLYENGVMHDLNDFVTGAAGWTLVEATGINELGQIVGYGSYNDTSHAFLLTAVAVPEPSAYAAIASVLVFATAASRRRRRHA